jgi:hypothetical protein
VCVQLYLRQQQQGGVSWNRTNCVEDNEGLFPTPGAALPSVAGRLLAGVDVDETDVQGSPTRVLSGCNPLNTPAKAKRHCCSPVGSPGWHGQRVIAHCRAGRPGFDVGGTSVKPKDVKSCLCNACL